MSYDDFWYNFTLTELFNAINGYYERENRREQEEWERTRLIYAAIVNKPVHGYRIKPKIPNKLLPFPWDNKGSLPDEEVLEQLRKETWGQGQ